MKTDISNKKKYVKQLKVANRSGLVEEASQKCCFKLYDKNVLQNVLAHLSKRRRKKSKLPVKETCPVEDSTDDKIDLQVKLRCRQLTAVVQELRKSIMRQDWDEATTLLMILCHPGLKYYSSIIMRACFILLCNHPNSSLVLLKNFIRQITQYILEEDINKFVRVLFALRKSGLEVLERGKYVRTGYSKVTMDPEFEKLHMEVSIVKHSLPGENMISKDNMKVQLTLGQRQSLLQFCQCPELSERERERERSQEYCLTSL